jgi:prepilin peptidase CpaA
MQFFNRPENWPVVAICIGMVAAAVIDWWKFKVPNKLTYPIIVAGWILGLAINFGWVSPYPDAVGGFGPAVAGTFLGLALILPIYTVGGMGAGDCKMTMGFGSWVGAFFGWEPGMWIIVMAFCVGAIVGGVIGAAMIALRGNFRQNAGHVREIMGDFVSGNGLGEIADRANKRRPRWHRLPYGVPLCIGFLGYLVWTFEIAAPTASVVTPDSSDLPVQAATK